jgi:ABC-2 type transport system permease protein
MPIHDQGYRHFEGQKDAIGRGWIVITMAGIRSLLRTRVFLGLLLFAWVPFIVRAVQIYAASNFPTASFLAVTSKTFREFLDQQGTFVFFVTIYVGAGLIANDRRANALQIYLSKPLTRAEYVAGKFGILATFLLFVTWLPAILLLIVQMLFSGSFTFITSNLILFPAITVLSFVQVTVAALSMLALSSLSKSSRFVAVMYAGLLFFTGAVYGVLYMTTRSTALSWISFSNNIAQIGDAVFRLPLRYQTPLAVSILAVVVLIGGSLFILERRIRGVEVVT